ncbi:MAG: pyrroline-5-carboxylate reductase [Lentisphaeria bacterium]|nr:pyrroline-5-carboxylate reductase [Lentisphaeria bacterium]
MSKFIFLGAGKMATAIAGGMTGSGLFKNDNLSAFDVSEAACRAFEQASKVEAFNDLSRVDFAGADYVFLAVKPQYLNNALSPIRRFLCGKTIISIVAGKTIDELSEQTGSEKIIRVMPNTPALVGAGVAAYCCSPAVGGEDKKMVECVFNAVGTVYPVAENLLDAVTALSGCGPAYVFDFIAALADGGVTNGLSRQTALKLAAGTVLGAAKMVLESDQHVGQLRDNVISPGGVTAVGVNVLEKNAFRGIVIEAVNAAAEKSKMFASKKK